MIKYFAGPVFSGPDDTLALIVLWAYIWAPFILLLLALLLKRVRPILSLALLVISVFGLLGVLLTFMLQANFDPLPAVAWAGFLAASIVILKKSTKASS